MNEQDVLINPSEAKTLLRKIIEEKDRDGLWEWIKEFLGMEIPRVQICPDHCAPFEFVADYFFDAFKDAIVLANRSGGKTQNFGVLDSMTMFGFDKTELAAVGAILFQTQKGYEYFQSFNSRFPFSWNVKSGTMKKTQGHNDSTVQILTGTMSGVNSPHPQILLLDEIDLMAWQVLQQALSMPQSKHGVEARTILTSTRKFGAGPMQRLLDEAKDRGLKVYQWCIWEVVEALPKDPEKLEKIKKEFGILPANIEHANGYYTWNDAISKHKTLDTETWETEWLCSKPGMEGIIYGSSYSDENNLLVGWSPVKEDGTRKAGYIYLMEDFGFGEGHPDVVLFGWVPPEFDRVILFDELYMTNYEDDQIWDAICDKLSEYGLTMKDIKGWACDYHGLTEIAYRKRRGAPIMEKHKVSERYVVWNGIKLVKRLMQTDRIMITDKLVNFRVEVLTYKKKKNLDGTYSLVIIKKDDHGPDALRYWVIPMFDAIARNAFEDIDESVQEPPAHKLNSPELIQKITQQSGDKPITAGMLGMKF